jgi:putative transposase
LWAYAHEVTQDLSRLGKPTDNAFIEVFNGRFRAECVNVHWFLTLADAREKMETWRSYYNDERPHGAIGNILPAALINANRAIGEGRRLKLPLTEFKFGNTSRSTDLLYLYSE